MNLDPITIEVIGAAMGSIVEETGETLIRASHSTNIKERRDCSTALFNAAGETLCQAEHIPIHLGSFLDLVPHIMRRYATQDIRPGDAFIGNDAYEGGGTHLPDIVLAEPIFVDGRNVQSLTVPDEWPPNRGEKSSSTGPPISDEDAETLAHENMK